MSRLSLRSSQQVESRPVGGFSIIEAPSIQPGDDLTLLQQLAMLQMMYSTVARGVAHRIAGDTQDKPAWSDYRALVEKGLCMRPENLQWHQLTETGRELANAMLARLCREHDIHVMEEIRTDDCARFRCSCRQWSSGIFKGSGMYAWRQANNSFRKHVPPLDANGNRIRKA